jgi:hypothetical protein
MLGTYRLLDINAAALFLYNCRGQYSKNTSEDIRNSKLGCSCSRVEVREVLGQEESV